MDIVILGDPDSYYCLELQRAARGRGHVCDVYPFERLGSLLNSTAEVSAGFPDEGAAAEAKARDRRPLQTYDACLVRAMPPGSLEQVVFRMDVLWSLEAAGVRVMNPPKSLECAIDKYLTLARCRHAGIAVPDTLCCESPEQALEQFLVWGEAVVKPIFGAEGRGILHLTDAETARRVFRALHQIGAVLYLQKYIAGGGSDLRLLMLDGVPLGAMRRTATVDFRTNCSQQGVASLHVPTSAEQDLARRACEAVGVWFGGVDLIYDPEGRLYLLEVNGCPGWKAFQSVTGRNVPEAVVKWLEIPENQDLQYKPSTCAIPGNSCFGG